jgi:hypothetical protein
MIKNGILTNIEKYGITYRDVDAVATHNDCMACALAKWKKSNHKEGSGIHPQHPGSSWSFDYQGPFDPATPDGCTGKITFICLATGYVIVFLVKSNGEVFECIEKKEIGIARELLT